MKQFVLFNNKGGVGKTTFIQHLGYALEKQGKKVLFIDADPQCNLTSSIFSEDDIAQFWSSQQSIYNTLSPIISGEGDVKKELLPQQVPNRNIWVLPGDLLLSVFEELLAERWVDVLAGRELGFRATSAIYRYIEHFTSANHIYYVLIDVGPNLGALNRAVLLGCDYFFVPMIPDMFSLRGLSNIGTTFVKWIRDWDEAKKRFTATRPFKLQNGKPSFAGYLTAQFNIYRQKETKAWTTWNKKIPGKIQSDIVDKLVVVDPSMVVQLNGGDYKLGDMKNYHSLVPLSQTSRKPIFELTAQDGVVGTHADSVKRCDEEYVAIARKIIDKLS